MNALRLTALCLAFASCGVPLDAQPDDELGTSSLSLSATDSAAVLAVVNFPGTDVAALDGKAGLDSRAAKNILARRNGADGVCPSDDDQPFATIGELDAVAYVGDTALSRLIDYAHRWPAPAPEVVEGVTFAGWESQAVVYGVNHIVPALLDGMIDRRASAALVAARPFTSVAQMGPLAYVGPVALARLRTEAPQFWSAMQNPLAPQPPHTMPATHAGTFDGVPFDDATAVKAIELCNVSTRDQLVLGGVPAAPAAAIVGNRPYLTLDQVAAVGGVGTATMQSLQRWAAASAADPVATLQAQLQPLTDGLWLTSETDAKLLFISAAGIGSTPVTERVLREVFTAQHDALIQQVMYVPDEIKALSTRTAFEEIDGLAFFDHVIGGADPNDPDSLAAAQRWVKLRDAMKAQLTDLKVYRFGTINISTFIIGRTSNGALAGLLTGQVET